MFNETSVKILGIDPGLRLTGWGLIEVSKSISCLGHGYISVPSSLSIEKRLRFLFDQLQEIFLEHQIDEVALEEIFVNTHGNSTIKLSMARGVITLLVALQEKPLFEYSANCIKKTIVGNGHASKDDVKKMLSYQISNLDLDSIKKQDSSDAIAIALCHANHRNLKQKIKL